MDGHFGFSSTRIPPKSALVSSSLLVYSYVYIHNTEILNGICITHAKCVVCLCNLEVFFVAQEARASCFVLFTWVLVLQISCMGTPSWFYTRDNLWLVFILQEAGKLLFHLVKGCDSPVGIVVSQKVVVTKFHMCRLTNIHNF